VDMLTAMIDLLVKKLENLGLNDLKIFSSNMIETPKSSRDGAEKRERKKKKKKSSKSHLK
jgi:hypothetical protein